MGTVLPALPRLVLGKGERRGSPLFYRVSVAEQGSQQYVRALLSLFSNRSGQITVRPARSHAAGFVCG